MRRVIISLAVLISCSSAASAAVPGLQIAVTAQGVVVSNVPKGGSIVLFSCSRYSQRRAIAVRPEARVLLDDDRDGVIRYTPPGNIPVRSVWIAVDQSSGETAAGAPRDFPLLVRAVGTSDLRKDVQGEIVSLAAALPRLVVLLVSPGNGAWLLAAFDGESTDRDGKKDGHVELSFGEATSVNGKDKAPNQVKKDDVIVAIDPAHLDVFITQVGR